MPAGQEFQAASPAFPQRTAQWRAGEVPETEAKWRQETMRLWKPFGAALFAALGLLFVAYMIASPVAEITGEDSNPGWNFIDRGDSSDGTKGIALKFRAWPSVEDKLYLMQEMKIQELEKKMELLYSKVWIIEWSDKKYRNIIFTEMICKRLEKKIDTLEFCNLLIPSAPKYNRINSL